ncbi:hypothetical protein [Micromonospora sp. SH-82]|uniref:hypothetical protein n=1 Tax=Micromonospora sp. SH-82 TaxID=3132938 RepID=UPI003EB94580
MPLTPNDVQAAVWLLVVHGAEEWPSGPICRNDGASFPCRSHRWSRRVLETHGLNERQIEALIKHGNPRVHVPFPFVLDRPSVRPGTVPGRPGAVPGRPGMGPGRPGTMPPRAGTVPARTGAPVSRTGAVPGRTPAVPPRTGRNVPYPVRGQAGRPATPPGRIATRPGLPSRPVAPPATAPRWSQAS